MTNIYYDISHIKGNCGLCGLPNTRVRSAFHTDCKRELDNLKGRMRRKHHGTFDEVAYRYGAICENVEWILRQGSADVQGAIGEEGEDAVLAFHIQRRRT